MDNVEKYIQAIHEIEDLTPSGFVFAKVQRMLKEQDVDLEDLKDVIQQDPILSARIIKVSNSAYYGYEEKATSLKESIDRLGLDEITALVADSVLGELAQDGLKHYQMSSFDYLEECIASAILMEYFCKSLDEVEDAYTIGLLSNIGKAVINYLLDNNVSDVQYEKGQNVRDWELKAVGFDHAFAGASLLKRWEFPSDMISAVMYQYEPEKIDEQQAVFDRLWAARELTQKLIDSEDGTLSDENQSFAKEILQKCNYNFETFMSDFSDLKDKLNAILVRK